MKKSRMIDFLSDLKEEAIDILQQHGVRYHINDSTHEILIRLFSFQARYISQRKRTVMLSNELNQKILTLPPKVNCAIHKMIGWAEQGVDINSFQSSSLHWSGGNRDYQNSLFGTVHLHLSADEADTLPVVKKNGFSKRSGQVLIARFQEDYAYFIDVMDHPGREDPAWTSKTILQIMKDNWPKLVEPFVLRNAALCTESGMKVEIGNEELFQLTSNGVNALMTVDDGVVFAPNGGVVLNGTNMLAVNKADKCCNEALSVQKLYEKNKKMLRRQARKMLIEERIPVPRKSDVHFEFFEELGRFAVFNRAFKIAWDYTENRLIHFPDYSIKQVRESRRQRIVN